MDNAETLFHRIMELHNEGHGIAEIAKETGLYPDQIWLIINRYEDQDTNLD